MLKEERFSIIVNELKRKGVVKVSELNEHLGVSEMTIRRDLVELEQLGELLRIHGGAKRLDNNKIHERSHAEKQNINIDNKLNIADKIANCIDDNEIVFLGAGTTIELVTQFLKAENLKIITNSLPLFNKIQFDDRFEVILVGGSYRSYTGSFVGSFANRILKDLHVNKAFIGVNGIEDSKITCYNEEEGLTQRIILDNSEKKYIIADSSKLNYSDFYKFYSLENIDYLITDNEISEKDFNHYSKIVKVL